MLIQKLTGIIQFFGGDEQKTRNNPVETSLANSLNSL